MAFLIIHVSGQKDKDVFYCRDLGTSGTGVTSDKGARCRPGQMQRTLFIQAIVWLPGRQRFDIQKQ